MQTFFLTRNFVISLRLIIVKLSNYNRFEYFLNHLFVF